MMSGLECPRRPAGDKALATLPIKARKGRDVPYAVMKKRIPARPFGPVRPANQFVSTAEQLRRQGYDSTNLPRNPLWLQMEPGSDLTLVGIVPTPVPGTVLFLEFEMP